MKRQRKQIEELEQYCEEVLQETATLDLRDNEEGRFSLLKNKVYDITVLLREKNQLLEKNKKETERLIADISHQLKTPITSLRMTNEILYMEKAMKNQIFIAFSVYRIVRSYSSTTIYSSIFRVSLLKFTPTFTNFLPSNV